MTVVQDIIVLEGNVSREFHVEAVDVEVECTAMLKTSVCTMTTSVPQILTAPPATPATTVSAQRMTPAAPSTTTVLQATTAPTANVQLEFHVEVDAVTTCTATHKTSVSTTTTSVPQIPTVQVGGPAITVSAQKTAAAPSTTIVLPDTTAPTVNAQLASHAEPAPVPATCTATRKISVSTTTTSAPPIPIVQVGGSVITVSARKHHRPRAPPPCARLLLSLSPCALRHHCARLRLRRVRRLLSL